MFIEIVTSFVIKIREYVDTHKSYLHNLKFSFPNASALYDVPYPYKWTITISFRRW